MKHASKKNKVRDLLEDEEGQQLKHRPDEFDTAYLIAEAAINEQPETASARRAPEPPAPAVVPSKPLTTVAALWPDSLQLTVKPQSSQTVTPKAVDVSFSLVKPGASQVSLCGEFNGWSPTATPMKQQDDGRWQVTLSLAPGQYQYKFVVDGEWIPDPAAQNSVRNQHGSLNSVLEVRP